MLAAPSAEESAMAPPSGWYWDLLRPINRRDDPRMASRVAVDTDVFGELVKALMWTGGPNPPYEAIAAVRIYYYLTDISVTPAVSAEMDERGDQSEFNWRSYHFHEVSGKDESYRGCVKGMAQRYMDYHSDPRDCTLVAEVECALVEALLTLNGDLIRTLGTQAEKVRILRPSEYWAQAAVGRGATPRITPRDDNPLSAATWWRW
jgi:hypothetical protein